MSAELLNFELVSPEEKLVEEPVRMAVIPGEEGEMGIGAGHSSFVVSLQPGVVRLFKNDNEADSHNIFITGGFADISDAGCSVLAEEAVNVRDLDEVELNKALEQKTSDLSLAEESTDVIRLERQIAIIKAKLSAVTGKVVF